MSTACTVSIITQSSHTAVIFALEHTLLLLWNFGSKIRVKGKRGCVLSRQHVYNHECVCHFHLQMSIIKNIPTNSVKETAIFISALKYHSFIIIISFNIIFRQIYICKCSPLPSIYFYSRIIRGFFHGVKIMCPF